MNVKNRFFNRRKQPDMSTDVINFMGKNLDSERKTKITKCYMLTLFDYNNQ